MTNEKITAITVKKNKKILTGNTVFCMAGLLPLSFMETGWNGRLRNWSYKSPTDSLHPRLEISVRSDRKSPLYLVEAVW